MRVKLGSYCGNMPVWQGVYLSIIMPTTKLIVSLCEGGNNKTTYL
jgi:hypothetical protein